MRVASRDTRVQVIPARQDGIELYESLCRAEKRRVQNMGFGSVMPTASLSPFAESSKVMIIKASLIVTPASCDGQRDIHSRWYTIIYIKKM